MVSVNSAFHNLITNEDTDQILFMVEMGTPSSTGAGNIYLSDDGDFSEDGIVFTDEMCSGEDYVCGCVPSRTMGVSIMNEDGLLNGHDFKWLKAVIGAQSSETAYTANTGENCRLVEGGVTYSGTTSGFYADSTLVKSGNCVGLLSFDNGYIYFFTESSNDILCYAYDISAATYARYRKFSPAMTQKFSDGKSVRITSSLYETWNGEAKLTYRLCPMGIFHVGQPKQTNVSTIAISDAFDIVHELDVDASPVFSLSSATNGKELVHDLAIYQGITVNYQTVATQSRFEGISVSLTDLANNSYSCRKLISYLCEAVGCNARPKPDGTLYIYSPSAQTSAEAYPIDAGRVAADGFEVQNYVTSPIDCVAVKSLDNETIVYPNSGGDHVYEFNGNPFVNTVNSTLFDRINDIPTYSPMTFTVICADPSFETGDLLKVYLTFGEDEVLLNHLGEEITTYTDEEITIVPSLGNYIVPLMSQTIKWCGKTFITYDIKGTDDRSGASYNNYTDTNARTSKYINADFIKAGTLVGVAINNGNGTFSVDSSGNLTASSAHIMGQIDASSGTISGNLTLTGSITATPSVNNSITIGQGGLVAANPVEEVIVGTQGILFRDAQYLTTNGSLECGQGNMDISADASIELDAPRIDLDNDIYYANHSSPIGTIVTDILSSDVSINAGSSGFACAVDLTPGLWIIFGSMRFSGVTGAFRSVAVSSTGGSYNVRIRQDGYTSTADALHLTCSGYLAPTANTTYYLNYYSSDACSAKATYTRIDAVRLL